MQRNRVVLRFLVAIVVLAAVAGAGASAGAGTRMFSASDASTPATPALAFTTANAVPYPLGKQALLQGVLTGGDTVASQTILLEVLDDAGTTWATVNTAVTNGTGHFAWFADPRKRTTYRATLATDPSITSGSAVVVPYPNITWFAGESRTTKRNRPWYAALTYKTTGSSLLATYRVVVERWEHHKWKRRDSWTGWQEMRAANPQPDSIYQAGNAFIMHKFKKRGSWRLRVEFPASSTLGATHSKWLHIKVK